jgi:hypothetical protein
VGIRPHLRLIDDSGHQPGGGERKKLLLWKLEETVFRRSDWLFLPGQVTLF